MKIINRIVNHVIDMMNNLEKHSFKIVFTGNIIIIGVNLIIDILATTNYDFWLNCNSYNISMASAALSQVFPFVFLSFIAESALKYKYQNASYDGETLNLQTAFELETSFFRNLHDRKTIASFFSIFIAMIYVAAIFINRMDLNFTSILPGLLALILNLICFYLIFNPKEELINDDIKPQFFTGQINNLN